MLREGSRIDIEVTSSDCELGSEGQRSTTTNVRMVGSSAPIRRVLDLVHKLAPRDLTVLITGETGTGKDVVARLVHDLSDRAGRPYVTVSCGGVDAEGEIVESDVLDANGGGLARVDPRESLAGKGGTDAAVCLAHCVGVAHVACVEFVEGSIAKGHGVGQVH